MRPASSPGRRSAPSRTPSATSPVLTQTVAGYGLPVALYSDLHGIFIKNPNRPAPLAEQLTGQRSTTQVRRALDDAGISWVGATSPQAKGRIERGWGTAQDRLRPELRRAGATTIDEANAVVPGWMHRHNERFAVPPADADRPGERGPTGQRSRPSSASTTRAGWHPTRRSAREVRAWPCRRGPTGAAGREPASSSRSGSMAAFGPATAASSSSCSRPRRRQ